MRPWDEQAGFAVIASFISPDELSPLIEEAERLFNQHGRRPAGVRLVLQRSTVFAALAASEPLKALVEPILSPRALVVRSLLFDKTPDANWDVPWHQDTTIAVEARVEVPGFGPWSVKEGVSHVRPPAGVLAAMLAVRVNLDPSGEDNGPLLVAPGSHLDGIRPQNQDSADFEAAKASCATEAGGIVMMRPLLFHASRKAIQPTHRRVLHLEFAATELPPPLRWAMA